MPNHERHGSWAAEFGRAESIEMLELMAAGAALPYPFGDALHLLEAMRAAPDDGEGIATSEGPRRGRVGFLTWLGERRRMRAPGSEGSGGGGRARGTQLPDRRVSA